MFDSSFRKQNSSLKYSSKYYLISIIKKQAGTHAVLIEKSQLELQMKFNILSKL